MDTKTFVPEYMHKWVMERDYGGEDLSEWYILIARTRDSYILENSNFECIKRDAIEAGFEVCGDVEELNCILLAEFGHWACGWIESLMIHESNIKALEWADNVKEGLDNYPIYDEQDYCERETDMIWNDVNEFVVRDYLRDNDLEYTDQMLDDLTSALIHDEGVDWEVNGYDEVIPYIHSNEDKDKFIENLLADLTEEYQHLKTCPVCHITFNPDKTACNCQMKLFLEEQND